MQYEYAVYTLHIRLNNMHMSGLENMPPCNIIFSMQTHEQGCHARTQYAINIPQTCPWVPVDDVVYPEVSVGLSSSPINDRQLKTFSIYPTALYLQVSHYFRLTHHCRVNHCCRRKSHRLVNKVRLLLLCPCLRRKHLRRLFLPQNVCNNRCIFRH